MSDLRRMSEDERYEQALTASASERRNRPRHLLLIPLILFCIAGLVLSFAIYSRETSRLRLEQQQQRFERLVTGVAQLRELESTDTGSNSTVFDPIPDLLSRMEGYATQAGLRDVPKVPQQRTDRTQGAVQMRYIYAGVTDPSLEALMNWVRTAKGGVPGLFVHSITLRPMPGRGWTMDVTFARWERERETG